MTTEADVRLKIDEQLAQAGWSLERGNLVEELSLKGVTRRTRLREMPPSYESSRDRLDYLLKGADGKPIAVVEAKNDESDPLEGKRQAEDYADHIASAYNVRPPFIFLANGD